MDLETRLSGPKTGSGLQRRLRSAASDYIDRE